MKRTGFCNDPSPGSHRYCDMLINDPDRSVSCECPCHSDMAPFDELDRILRERLAAQAVSLDDEMEDDQ